MAESFEFREVYHFTSGAVGEPGDRTFYIQASDGERLVSVKLEKQQVGAIATYLRTILEDMPAPSAELEPLPLREPVEAEWVVGQIAVGVSEEDAQVVLVIEELAEEPYDEDDLFADVSVGASLRVHLTVDQAAQFIITSDDLMDKGRPPCRLCGQPETPGGHVCPRLN